MAKLKTGRHTSAIKAWRKSEKRAARNKGVKAEIKNAVKEFNTLLKTGNAVKAKEKMRKIESLLDKAAAKGVMHKRTSSRKKSRLTLRLNSFNSSSSP